MLDFLVRKELSGVSRRWQTWLARSAYVAVVAFAVWLFWRRFLGRASSVTQSDYADLARGLFYASFWGQLLLVIPASVAAATDLLGREIRSGTLGLLLITPLPGRAIAVAKWKASMAHGLSLVLCGLPVTAMCVYLGGVGVLELAWSACLLAASAAASSAYALLHAVRCPAGDRVFLGALARILLMSLAPVLGILAGPFAVIAIFYAHPVWAAVAASFPFTFGPVAAWGWTGATVCSLLFARWCLWRTGNELVRWNPPRLEAPPQGAALETLIRAGLHRPVVRPPVWEANPLLWKEVSLRDAAWGDRRRRAIAMVLFALVSFLWLAASTTLQPLALVLLVLAVANGASAFSPAREEGAWDVLLSAPLTSWQIVRTKLLAGLLGAEAGVALLIALVLPVVLCAWTGPAGVLFGLLAWSLLLAFAYVLGAAVAVRSRSMRGALTGALGLLAALLFLPGLVPGGHGPTSVLDAFDRSLARDPEQALALAAGKLLSHAPLALAAIGMLVWSMVRAVRNKPVTA